MSVRTIGMVLAAAAGMVSAGPVDAASLHDELVGVFDDHPQITAAEKSVESARKGIDKAFSDYYPTVSVTGDMGPEVINNPTERAKQEDSEAWKRARYVAGATVTQNLFNGFATVAAVNTAKLTTDVARHTLDSTRQSTAFEAVAAYVDVLRQRRLVDLAIANERNIQDQAELEDERVRRGEGITLDVLDAKTRLQTAKVRRVEFESALQDSLSRYVQVFNHPPDLASMADPQPPLALLPEAVDTAVEVGLRENPAMANSQSSAEVARERREAINAEYYPTIDLEGAWNYEDDKNTVVGIRRDYSVLVTLSWDLFNGFSTDHSKGQAAFDYAASKDNLAYVTRKVEEQVRLAWQALLTARDRIRLLENAVALAAERHEGKKAQHLSGKENILNVLDAEKELYDARIQYASASYDEITAVYQLLLAMGRLTPQSLAIDME